jgi:hypothetical protein
MIVFFSEITYLINIVFYWNVWITHNYYVCMRKYDKLNDSCLTFLTVENLCTRVPI